MKAGKLVVYVDASGRTHDALVLDVVGSGVSGYKLCDLAVGKRTYKAVTHERDSTGKGYWREHAAPNQQATSVPAPAVPVQSAGRATAGVGDDQPEP